MTSERKDMRKVYLFLVVLLIVTVVLILHKTLSDGSGLTPQQIEILKVSNNKAMSLGYDVDNMRIIYDFNNVIWYKDRVQEDPDFNDVDFQAIYYGPKDRGTLGGSLIVIVDKNKKDVIWLRRGQ